MRTQLIRLSTEELAYLFHLVNNTPEDTRSWAYNYAREQGEVTSRLGTLHCGVLTGLINPEEG